MTTLLSPLGLAKIYLYGKPTDMRKSFDGLHALVQSEFRRDIRTGDVSFCFSTAAATASS